MAWWNQHYPEENLLHRKCLLCDIELLADDSHPGSVVFDIILAYFCMGWTEANFAHDNGIHFALQLQAFFSSAFIDWESDVKRSLVSSHSNRGFLNPSKVYYWEKKWQKHGKDWWRSLRTEILILLLWDVYPYKNCIGFCWLHCL